MFQSTSKSNSSEYNYSEEKVNKNRIYIADGNRLPPAPTSNTPTQLFVEEEETLQKKDDKELQAKTIQRSSNEEEVQMKESPSKGGQTKLPDDVRSKMEGSFGADLSSVNIHTNDNSATDMGALAYTQGEDVHFAPGQYNPSSTKGQELIGHELTHTIQQRQGRVKPDVKQNKGGANINSDKGLEKEADEIGALAAQGKMANVSGNGSGVQLKSNEESVALQLQSNDTASNSSDGGYIDATPWIIEMYKKFGNGDIEPGESGYVYQTGEDSFQVWSDEHLYRQPDGTIGTDRGVGPMFNERLTFNSRAYPHARNDLSPTPKVDFSPGLTILNEDGTMSEQLTNEYGMIRFPENGPSFERYSAPGGTGNNENYSVDGTSHNGDNYATPHFGASLYNAFSSFNDLYPDLTFQYGDMSAYDPSINLGHSSTGDHSRGTGVDIRYMGENGQALIGDSAYQNASVSKNNAFLRLAELYELDNNYSYGSNLTHQGDNNNSIHKNHIHTGIGN